MMRSLWTAASGMSAQQTNIDVISNNLANVNTNGYKRERAEFKTLLYDTIARASLDPANNVNRPVNLQIGLGVRPIATSRIFTTGNIETTGIKTDFYIEGEGFFAVRDGLPDADNNVAYTKDGSFKLSIGENGLMLVTSEGYPVLNVDGEAIILPADASSDRIFVEKDGTILYPDANNVMQDLGMRMNVVQFQNPQGLESIGSNLFKTTSASGEPVLETDGVNKPSNVRQGTLEMSNVQVAQEMVSLIIAQRAYELNSKAITTSDEMLQQANNLKR